MKKILFAALGICTLLSTCLIAAPSPEPTKVQVIEEDDHHYPFLRRLHDLNDATKKKVEDAYESALKQPAVQASREKMIEAARDFRQTLHDAMIKTDSSIKDVLEKAHGKDGQDHAKAKASPTATPAKP